MAGELATLAAETAPFVTAYGAAVLAKTKDDLADETVGLGKRLLQLIFRRKKEDEQLPDIVVEAVENPDDNAVRGMLEYTIRKALENDAQMLAEVREILAEAGPRAKITQNVRAGRNAYVVGQGNMNITRTTDLAGATRWPLNRPADLCRGSKSHLLALAEAGTTRSARGPLAFALVPRMRRAELAHPIKVSLPSPPTGDPAGAVIHANARNRSTPQTLSAAVRQPAAILHLPWRITVHPDSCPA